MDDSFIKDRIEVTKAIIIVYEGAIQGIVSGAIDSYTLDTGQNRTVVTKLNISTLTKARDSAYVLLGELEARLNGCGGMVVPGW